VENSLGRLWLLNRPQSKLAAKMDYYIAPEEPETDFLRITRPEDIRICDPACGSGHMLTYAFDLLYEIYAEEGHDSADIPGLILKHNLTGIEIDDRAGALAAFALSMKAAAKLGRRRFLRMEAKPDIVVLQDVHFTPAEMQDVAAVVGKDLFTDELRETLGQFEQAKNFGSLIVPKLRDPAETLRVVAARDFGGDLLLKEVQERVVSALRMAEALSPKYHVVVANPPYLGGRNMNEHVRDFVAGYYPDSKSDLFSAFIERGLALVISKGYPALVTMESWMMLSAFENLRKRILEDSNIVHCLHMPYAGKGGTAMGISFGTSAFVLRSSKSGVLPGVFTCARYYELDDKYVPFEWPIRNERFSIIADDSFLKIPGNPIAYWVGEKLDKAYSEYPQLYEGSISEGQNITADNERFTRQHWEIDDCGEGRKWRLYAKGGEFRKWAGNIDVVVNWSDEATAHYRAHSSARIIPDYLRFRSGVTWSRITSSSRGFRYLPAIATFDKTGSSIFFNSEEEIQKSLLFLNSKVSMFILDALNPTISLQVDDVRRLPFDPTANLPHLPTATKMIELSQSDWDGYETSWDFTTLPLLAPEHRADTLAASYATLRSHWQSMTDEMQRLEEENNRIFIDAYGLQDELTPEVPIEEITLTCNPAYRYGVKGTEADREARLREETVAELLHYAVGCMFGRYSLDAPGLILANQGEGIEEYLARVPEPSFAPDRNNVIPVLDADWFADDIVTRARDFLRVTFGEAKFRENLAFIEKALGKDLRRWFTKDFFDYHVRRYKKRPIYWMFSSPKGSFNALIYMHRYRPDTVSVVLNQYVREFIHKLEVERARLEKLAVDTTATPAQQTKAQKETATVIKQIAELTEWERDVVYPMAQQKIAIDLDDGVKRNYPLFAGALKPIKGLEAADD